jgi:hypothetical protein
VDEGVEADGGRDGSELVGGKRRGACWAAEGPVVVDVEKAWSARRRDPRINATRSQSANFRRPQYISPLTLEGKVSSYNFYCAHQHNTDDTGISDIILTVIGLTIFFSRSRTPMEQTSEEVGYDGHTVQS